MRPGLSAGTSASMVSRVTSKMSLSGPGVVTHRLPVKLLIEQCRQRRCRKTANAMLVALLMSSNHEATSCATVCRKPNVESVLVTETEETVPMRPPILGNRPNCVRIDCDGKR